MQRTFKSYRVYSTSLHRSNYTVGLFLSKKDAEAFRNAQVTTASGPFCYIEEFNIQVPSGWAAPEMAACTKAIMRCEDELDRNEALLGLQGLKESKDLAVQANVLNFEKYHGAVEKLQNQLKELETKHTDLFKASVKLREAQQAYMADRGNNELGKLVGVAASELDVLLTTLEA